MGSEKIKRTEAIEGELVTIYSEGNNTSLGYFLNDTVYVIESQSTAIDLSKSYIPVKKYERDGGKGFMDWIRFKRKTAKTPYKTYPIDLSTLTEKQTVAYTIIKENGGIISRKALAERMNMTNPAASKLMNSLVDAAIASIDIDMQVIQLTNSADQI